MAQCEQIIRGLKRHPRVAYQQVLTSEDQVRRLGEALPLFVPFEGKHYHRLLSILDDTVLLPLVGRRTTGLPIVGGGPKAKICPDCSTLYPQEAEFCGNDGSSLVNVN